MKLELRVEKSMDWPRRLREFLRQHVLIGGGIILALAVATVVIWVLRVSPADWAGYAESLTRLEQVARILTPIAVVVGIAVAFYRSLAAHKQAETAFRQVETAEQGQITERFTKAVEQLANERLAVRLGGIYALERIAQDSKRDHWTVMEVLCAYVREHCPQEDDESKSFRISSNLPEGLEPEDLFSEPSATSVSADIQVILTVLIRRKAELDPVSQGLDLEGANLAGVDFRFANLSRANLSNANLSGANLSQANLGRAFLIRTNLTNTDLALADLSGANLAESNLSKTNLIRARLSTAVLSKANLNDANLSKADLRGANVTAANLSGSNLSGADLSGAHLSSADNLEQWQINSANGDEKTILSGNLKRPAHWDSELRTSESKNEKYGKRT